MKNNLGICIVLAGLALWGCAQKKDSSAIKDSDGNCQQDVINAHNEIKFRKDNFELYGYAGVSDACDVFQNKIQGQSCRALNTATGGETTVSYSTVQSTCEAAKSLKNKPAAGPIVPKNEPQVLAKVESKKLIELKKPLQMTIIDEETLNPLFTDKSKDGIHSIENGKSVSKRDYVSMTCKFLVETPIEVKAGDKLGLVKFHQDKPNSWMKLSTENDEVVIACFKWSTLPWTIQDLKEIFKSTADFSESN